jgi:hypothetical protein
MVSKKFSINIEKSVPKLQSHKSKEAHAHTLHSSRQTKAARQIYTHSLSLRPSLKSREKKKKKKKGYA